MNSILWFVDSLQDAAQRKIRFTSTHPPKELFDKIESVVMEMGFEVHRGPSKVAKHVL